MDQYLLQILKETNTIIIPGLGALTITNTTTGEVMFMPYLKHDDGKLSAHIAAKEGIEENEAKNIVAKYVREIQTSIDKGESYDIFQFGTFNKGADGDIEFKNWEADKGAPATEVPIAAPVVVKKPKTETPKAKESVKEKPALKKEAKVTTVVVPEPKVKTPKAEEKKTIPVVVPATPPSPKKPTPAPKKEMNIAEKEELSKTTKKLEKLKKEKAERKPKKKRGVGFYMLMGILLLIIVGGTYFAMDYDNLKQHVPFLVDAKEKKSESKELDKLKDTMGDEDQDPEEVIVDKETLEIDPIVEETPGPQPEIEPVAVRSGSNDQPFHIVAGAFGSVENANRLVERLKGMGYPAKTFMRDAKNIVSVQSYATKAEAQADISNVKDGAPKGWVLEWR